MTLIDLIRMIRDGGGSRSVEISYSSGDEFHVKIVCKCGGHAAVRSVANRTPGSYDEVLVDWKIAEAMRDAEQSAWGPPASDDGKMNPNEH